MTKRPERRAVPRSVDYWLDLLNDAHTRAEQAFAPITRAPRLTKAQAELLLKIHDDLIDLGRDTARLAYAELERLDRAERATAKVVGRNAKGQRVEQPLDANGRLTGKPVIDKYRTTGTVIVTARDPRKIRRTGASR